MPIYAAPRHGATLSMALKEAAAIAPVERAMLGTFELYHPIGTPDGPVYTVNDMQPFNGVIDAGAARNPGAAVTFMACPVTITRPEENDSNGNPEVAIVVSNIQGVMSDALRAARGSLVPWQLTERIYASDDSSGPAVMPPMSVYLTNVDINGEAVQLKASFGDSINVAVPRITFKRTTYPTLVR